MYEQRKWAQAVISLKSLFKSRPSDLGICVRLSEALTFLKRREEALTTLMHCKRVAPKTMDHWIKMKIDRISSIFYTEGASVQFEKGLKLFLGRKFRSSVGEFYQALTQESDNVEILLKLAQAYLLEGNAAAAVENLRFARRLNPFRAEGALWLGRAYALKGETENAESEFLAARDLGDRSEIGSVWLAEAIGKQGQIQRAVKILEEDIQKEPMHLASLYTKAHFLVAPSQLNLWGAKKDLQLLLSRYDESRKILERATSEERISAMVYSPESIRSKALALLGQIEVQLKETSGSDQ